MVRFENVGLRYGMGPEVLRDVNFSIEPRSFQYLTGPSGAGKTTLLRLILLALKPTRGLVSHFGKDVARIGADGLTDLRRRMGVVFQDFRLLDHLTVYENVSLPLRVIGKDEGSYRAEVVEFLRWVGLGERMHAFPPILSGGEKQRAAIARALITRPELLLADEPTGNVDPTLARRLIRLFFELQGAGTAVIIATHDLALMDKFDARRLVLADALWYTQDRFKPRFMINLATLTGAARVALGPQLPALFCRNMQTARHLVDLGLQLDDPLWHMPLWAPYRAGIESSVGDIVNTGRNAMAGAINAALFLEYFVEPEQDWIHVDLFAWNDAARPGRPVGGEAQTIRTLLAYLEERFA